jgi:hypothetical protein
VRFIKINWAGFAHTNHWLRGVALFAYLMHEAVMHYQPDLRSQPVAPASER